MDKPKGEAYIVCGALTRAGGQCPNWAMPNGRCYHHGGAHPKHKGVVRLLRGRFAADVPERLTERYVKAVKDPRLIELRDDLALMETRLAELLRHVDALATGDLWTAVGKKYREVQAAKNAADLRAVLTELGDLIERGRDEHAAWGEIRSTIDQRRRLAESERQRLMEAQQMVTVEQMMSMLALVQDIVMRYVQDRGIRQSIATEFSRLAEATALPSRN